MVEGEEWKTAIPTRYGLLESLVMPFRLTNAVVTFRNYLNDVLAPFLDRLCMAYLDDTLIYTDNFVEHQQYVRMVLEAFAKASLHVKLQKYEFCYGGGEGRAGTN
jgi:hypothetical protein